MNQWIEFLLSINAKMDNGQVIHFGTGITEELKATTKACISPLTHYGIIAISGPDAPAFIQNQFSNDVRLVSANHSQLNAYCSPKGRVLAFFRLLLLHDRYLLILPKERLTAIQQRLKMFVLMSQVTIEDISEQLALVGCCGGDTEDNLKKHFAELPELGECKEENQTFVINVSNSRQQYIVLGPTSAMPEIWNQLSESATITGPHMWQWHSIQAGIPEVYENTADEFVPQMLNLHSINAINFKKGCYPGQEVVARMHYLGKQKRRMYLGWIGGNSKPLPGENLISKQDPGGQSVGKIVCATQAPQGGFDLLAVIQTKYVGTNEQITTKSNEEILFRELPYVVELEGKKQSGNS